ncbi:RNA polymerase sigma factor [Pedobacter sp. L105]|uniref:RNA polymerase sigma factor n=1 Tax=Pedobacter sp. L105 TaxID=1641871 RepID=UPI00131CAF72|nr:RNA polymerase sigma-70 factor [Pedobacter sp. L105]
MNHLDTLSEVELLGLLKLGDKRVFDHFYKSYSLPIYRKLLKMTKVDILAEELMQDVFVRLWDKRHLIESGQPFKSYLYTIAQNIVYDFYRKAAREERLQSEVKAFSTELYHHTEEKIFFKETREILDKAINQLPAQQKLVFTLCKMEGKSYEEVSKTLGISTSTINGHIVKATKNIKEYMFNYEHITLAFSIAVMMAVNKI